jgi:hypothetical protein
MVPSHAPIMCALRSRIYHHDVLSKSGNYSGVAKRRKGRCLHRWMIGSRFSSYCSSPAQSPPTSGGSGVAFSNNSRPRLHSSEEVMRRRKHLLEEEPPIQATTLTSRGHHTWAGTIRVREPSQAIRSTPCQPRHHQTRFSANETGKTVEDIKVRCCSAKEARPIGLKKTPKKRKRKPRSICQKRCGLIRPNPSDG